MKIEVRDQIVSLIDTSISGSLLQELHKTSWNNIDIWNVWYQIRSGTETPVWTCINGTILIPTEQILLSREN